MILDRTRLVSILNILGTSVGNKVLEVSHFIAFSINREDHRLYLSTTNFLAYLTMDFGDLSLNDFSDVPEFFLIEFKQFSAVIKNSTTAEVSITFDGKTIVVTTNGKYRFNLYERIEDFPEVVLDYEKIGSWAVPILQQAWSKARIAVSQDVTKIAYQGVNYDGNFAASDNRRLSCIKGIGTDCDPIILPPLVGDILKNCKNEVVMGMPASKNAVILECKEIGLIASIRLIDAKFVDYKGIIQNRALNVKSVVVSKQEILGAISRLIPFTDQVYKVVEVSTTLIDGIEGKSIVFELRVENKNAGSEPITVKEFVWPEGDDSWNGESNQMIGFKWNYHIDNLCDGISVTDDNETVSLSFQEDGKLWIDEKEFCYLLTSIRV